MRVSEEGIDFIKQFEGFRAKTYRCSAGVLTVGYGHTGPDVRDGDEITEEIAEQLLEADLAEAEAAVNDYVDVALEQHEFDALVSFTFNCGVGALRASTLLKLLNQGRYSEAAVQFHRWNKADGKVVQGLVNRRAAEAELFGGKA